MSSVAPNHFAIRASSEPLARLLDQHARLGGLCDRLEAIADDLPRACPSRCIRAAAELQSLVPDHHAFEAAVLGKLLPATRGDLLARILRQHDEDEGLALEIAHELEPAGEGRPVADAERLGYMLRGFFTSCRRSMLIEELAIAASLPRLESVT